AGDGAETQPLRLSKMEGVVRNIRNVKSDPDDFPSPLTLQAAVFDSGRLSLDGSADFLRGPYAGVKGKAELAGIPLDYAKPVAARYGLALTAGVFSGNGYLEVTPNVTIVDLEEMRVDGLKADYAYRPRVAAPVKEAAKKTAETAVDKSNAPDAVLRARRVIVKDAAVGFVNENARPTYRVSLTPTA